MYDNRFIGAWDLTRGDVTVTIARIEATELTGSGGKKARKPVLFFDGKEKGFAAGKASTNVIARMYGPEVNDWVGKRITLYATKTNMAGEEVDCIRVRNVVPAAAPAASKKQASQPEPTAASEREPGED